MEKRIIIVRGAKSWKVVLSETSSLRNKITVLGEERNLRAAETLKLIIEDCLSRGEPFPQD